MESESGPIEDRNEEATEEEMLAQWKGFCDHVAKLAIEGGANGIYLFVNFADKNQSYSIIAMDEILIARAFMDLLDKMHIFNRGHVTHTEIEGVPKGG